MSDLWMLPASVGAVLFGATALPWLEERVVARRLRRKGRSHICECGHRYNDHHWLSKTKCERGCPCVAFRPRPLAEEAQP